MSSKNEKLLVEDILNTKTNRPEAERYARRLAGGKNDTFYSIHWASSPAEVEVVENRLNTGAGQIPASLMQYAYEAQDIAGVNRVRITESGAKNFEYIEYYSAINGISDSSVSAACMKNLNKFSPETRDFILSVHGVLVNSFAMFFYKKHIILVDKPKIVAMVGEKIVAIEW